MKEDNVTISAGMLTNIPEVDLGIENKLKNVERTEQAKREFLEKLSKPEFDNEQDRLLGASYLATEKYIQKQKEDKKKALSKNKKDDGKKQGSKRISNDEALLKKFQKKQRF